MAKAKPDKITAGAIRAGMARTWGAPEYAIMWEVGEGTGAGSGRYADAVIASLWPSRGLELHGVEIKVSRSDWKREAADPRKAEAVGKFCDRWYIHTPPGLIADISEMPPAWGLREFDGRAWRTVKEAEKTEAAPISRPFLAAMLRRADGTMRALLEEGIANAREAEYLAAEKRQAEFTKRVEEAAERRTAKLSRVADQIEQFKAAFGEDVFSEFYDLTELGKAARALEVARRSETWGSYLQIENRLRAAADAMAEARQALGIEQGKAAA